MRVFDLHARFDWLFLHWNPLIGGIRTRSSNRKTRKPIKNAHFHFFLLNQPGGIIFALDWFACVCVGLVLLCLFVCFFWCFSVAVLPPLGLLFFIYCKKNRLCFPWFGFLLLWVSAMQVKFCLHSCKNFCSVLVVFPVWMCFSALRPRSLLNLLLPNRSYLSERNFR